MSISFLMSSGVVTSGDWPSILYIYRRNEQCLLQFQPPSPLVSHHHSQTAMSSLWVSLWDLGLTVINSVTPAKSEGKVTPEGHPGFGGKWPEFVPPKEGDSRCSCPALNALANHSK